MIEIRQGLIDPFVSTSALLTPRRRALDLAAKARARERFSADVIVPRCEALYRRPCR
jgi:hypothetical protein